MTDLVQAETCPGESAVGAEHVDNSDCEIEISHLYAKYEPQLLAYARRRASASDVNDVVVETFLTAWRRRDDIPAEPKTLPWLYGVCRRVLANQRRSERRRDRLFDRLVQERSPSESPVHLAEVDDSFGDVAMAVNALPEHDAELLRLTAWEGLGPTEIAESLGIEPTAARQRLFRARKRLNAEIERRAELDARRTRIERVAVVILVLAVVLGAIIMSGVLGASVDLETDLINDGESGARQVIDSSGEDEIPGVIVDDGILPDAPVASPGVALVDEVDGLGDVVAVVGGEGVDASEQQPEPADPEVVQQLGSNQPEAEVVDAADSPAQQLTPPAAETAVVEASQTETDQPDAGAVQSPAVVLTPGATEPPASPAIPAADASPVLADSPVGAATELPAPAVVVTPVVDEDELPAEALAPNTAQAGAEQEDDVAADQLAQGVFESPAAEQVTSCLLYTSPSPRD